MIAILGDWFSKKHRGAIIGLWTTCIQIGNIIGVQLASLLLHIYGEDNWWGLMFTIASVMIVLAIIFIGFLKPDP